jgi:putative ABC transport system substrate-binding protein
MRRREFIAFLGAAAAAGPGIARAQSGPRIFRIATINPLGVLPEQHYYVKLLVPALARRGYRVGDNLALELPRPTEGPPPKLPQVIERLKAVRADAVVTIGYPSVAAAKDSGLPTIMGSGSGDPVATGLINSLARPGGNITGVADDVTMLSTKRLALLKEAVPSLKRIAMLWNKDDLGMSLRYEASAKAARDLGVTVQALGVREPDDFNEAFTIMNRDLPDAILMVSDSLTVLNRKRVFDFAAERRLPAIFEADSLVAEGGLMSYGADARESFERVADFADRIFKGAKPADLPVEQPTRYLFMINLKTATAMNLTLSNTVLALADGVIE